MGNPIIGAAPTKLALDEGLFGRLRRDCGEDWTRYVTHPFLGALADGTLPVEGFREFLIQDYLYLIHYARAYALAAFKSQTLKELRAYSRSITALVDAEMPVHIAFCRDWGLSEQDLVKTPERLETIAYTRFLIDRGLSGDLLDLQAALVPCIAGYAEVGDLIRASPKTVLQGNPYARWIESYGGDEYRTIANAAIFSLNAAGAAGGADARYASLLATFRSAVRLETAFWGIGWPTP